MSIETSLVAALSARASLARLRPYDAIGVDKIRVGNVFDGGYVMMDVFDGVQAAYSFGINDDIAWDFEMANRAIDIFQYDHTIEALPEENPRFFWEKLGIAAQSAENMISVSDIVKKHGHDNFNNIILKCDIEAAEWEVFASLTNDILRKFSQIVIEVHDIRRVGDPGDAIIHRALTNLTRFHNVVHVHGNNYGGIGVVGGIPLANVLELTLLRKDLAEFRPSGLTFPTPLDRPCNGADADIFLGSFTF